MAGDDPAKMLKDADDIKSADHEEFVGLLSRLDAEADHLTPAQAEYLRFLKAWQTAYAGDFASAIPQLNVLANTTKDQTLRFRAGMLVVNVLSIAARYEEAYTRLSQMLDLLPNVTDPKARQQGLGVAAYLYSQAGQYELAVKYADEQAAEEPQGNGSCTSAQLALHAKFRSGALRTVNQEFLDGLDACTKANEPIWANLIRIDAARIDVAQDDYRNAISLLESHYDETQHTHYREVVSGVDAELALAYWKSGDTDKARLHAQRVVDGADKKDTTEPMADACEVLYEIAKSEGNAAAALGWYEKYATTDKGYLNDVSARALAYQMVHQQVQEKKAQVAALSQQNQMLTLRQAVGRKNMIAVQLGIALLLVVLGSIALYAYRTKRSQLKFQKLARRDGLTGIHNRQYFIEAAERELAYCRKSMRDASLVAIDLDHFKQINDIHGHAAGDFALKRAVAACQKHLRSVDIFGRLGGEEFGILMPDSVPEQAADVAEKMRAEIAGLQNSADGPEFGISASFGVTAARWSGYALLQLLAQADSTLYQAKREGRNCVVVHGTSVTPAEGSHASMPDRRIAQA